MNAKDMIIGLIPWILFSFVAGHTGTGHVGWAAVIACAASAGLAVYGMAKGQSLKIIDAAGVVTFGVIAVIGFVGGSSIDAHLADYGRGASTFILAAVMFVSAFTIPFTEQYARETVDQRYWGSPVFRAKNRSISLLWAGAVFAMAVCHVISGVLAANAGVDGGHPGSILLNWVIPIALIFFAVKRTQAIAEADTPASTTPAAQA
ncbi:hypothetical protein [Gordonia soli]|uniref:Uncharacterized protein n=1 Tax=Gordonia soli NBRC 108243 TaxID=1223545 RepID=M0QEH4_9ACTN|nr:hypothetical protein [Gordonia soli]GAC66980.1 hypothetical protein GS4_05_01930 [Gordonia soli NBRC 108243]